MDPTLGQQIEMLETRVAQYEEQIGTVQSKYPMTNEEARLVLSLQAQLSEDKKKIRALTGKV